jgi:peptidoglycan/LPS O-acetylase OafA/YrhL
VRGGASQRIVALDGLRGLAALAVVFGHGFGAVDVPGWGRLLWVHSPLAVAINAIGAVHLFFVLSGYVLAASAERGGRAVDLAQFYVRRVFRIQPPFVVALLATWLLSLAYVVPSPGEGVSPEYVRHLQADAAPRELLAALAFPGNAGGLLPHGYTLAVELIFSFLLPLMLWVSRRLHWAALLPFAAWGIGSELGPYAWPRYTLDFALGIGLYRERERLGRLFAAMSPALALALLVAALCVFTYPTWAVRPFERWAVIPFALGGSGLVAGALHLPRFAALLSSRPVAALGRVSYSSYLLHFAVLCTLTRLIDHTLGVAEAAAFMLLVAALALAVAAASYRWIERPSIRAGNRVCVSLANAFGRPARPSRRFAEAAGASEPAAPSP